jgi:hypothetical protein
MFFWFSEDDGYVRVENKRPNRTEIPVPHFLDLMHDCIAHWRLEDDGFDRQYTDVKQFTIRVRSHTTVMIERNKNGSFSIDVEGVPFYGVKTYTQLLTLIELIG